MGRRLLAFWESQPPRRQVLIGAPTTFLVLLAVHLVGFPHLTLARSASYALMEALPLALVVTYATQVELVRREAAAGRADAAGAQHEQQSPADAHDAATTQLANDGAAADVTAADRDIADDVDGAGTPAGPNSGAGHPDA